MFCANALRWALFWCICNRNIPLLGFELRSSGMQVQYSTNRTILGYLLLSELVGMPYDWLFSSVTPGRKLMHVYSYFGIKITIFFIVMSKLILKNLVRKYTSLILKYHWFYQKQLEFEFRRAWHTWIFPILTTPLGPIWLMPLSQSPFVQSVCSDHAWCF